MHVQLSDAGAHGGVLSSETTQQLLLVGVGLISEATDDLGGSVNTLGNWVSGDEDTGLGVLLMDFFTVLHFVLEDNLEDLSGLVGLLILLGGNDSLGTLDGAGGGTLGSVVHVGGGEWVVSPLVTVELLEESIVSLGEGPNNAVGSLHIYREASCLRLGVHWRIFWLLCVTFQSK